MALWVDPGLAAPESAVSLGLGVLIGPDWIPVGEVVGWANRKKEDVLSDREAR